MSNKLKSRLFLAFLFLNQVGSYFLNMGSLVFSSKSEITFTGPALVALVQALAALGALLIANVLTFKKGHKLLIFALAATSVLNSSLNLYFSEIVLPTLFLRLLFGSLLGSFLLSTGPRYISKQLHKGTQVVQVISSVAALVGFGLAPIFGVSLAKLAIIDLAFILISLLLLLFNSEFLMAPESETKTASFTTKSSSNGNIKQFLFVFSATLIVWSFGGIFQVVEVPMLIHRFHLDESQISLLFILTILVDLASVSLLGKATNRYPWFVLISGTVLMAAFGSLYIFTHSVYLLIFSLFVIGLASGAFSFAQSQILQKIENNSIRLNSFIFSRLVTQFGIILGASIVGSGLFINPQLISSEGPNNTGNKKRNLDVVNVYVSSLEPLKNSIEPYKIVFVEPLLVLHQIFESLFEYDSRNNLLPNLIETLYWGDQNRSLVLRLKKDRFFSNGDPLLAIDVKNAILEAKTYLGPSGLWAFEYLENLEALDNYNLKFKFTKPFTLMPAILASSNMAIFKRDKSGKVVGTGFYRLAERSEHEFRLTKNTYYLPDEQNAPSEIMISEVIKPKTEYTLSLQNPGVHWPLNQHRFKSLQALIFAPNFKKESMSKKENRCKIINDLSQIASSNFQNLVPTEMGLPFSSNLFTNSPKTFSGRVIRNENKTPELNILYSDSAAAQLEKQTIEEMQSYFNKINLPIKFIRLTQTEWIKKIKTGQFDGIIFGFVPDFVHPHSLLGAILGSGQEYNFGRFTNTAIDKLLAKGVGLTDRIKQGDIYSEVLKINIEECGVAFLGSQEGVIYLSPSITPPDIGQLGAHNIHFKNLKLRGT